MNLNTTTANLLGIHFTKEQPGFVQKFTEIANKILLIDDIRGAVLKKDEHSMIMSVDNFVLDFSAKGIVMSSPVFFHNNVARFIQSKDDKNMVTFYNFYGPIFSNRQPVIMNDNEYKNYTDLFYITAGMIFNQVAFAVQNLNIPVRFIGCMQYHYLKSENIILWPFFDKISGVDFIGDWNSQEVVARKQFKKTGTNDCSHVIDVTAMRPANQDNINYGLIVDYQIFPYANNDLKLHSLFSACHNIELMYQESQHAFNELSIFDYTKSMALELSTPSKTIH